MTTFERDFFRRFEFSQDQIRNYLQNALRDLGIAREDKFPEVRFTYSYQALIKAAIALLAKEGKVKVRSVPGHHAKLIEKLSKILGDDDVLSLGNAMRTKRNLDFYGGGTTISEKEADEYFRFAESVIDTIKSRIL